MLDIEKTTQTIMFGIMQNGLTYWQNLRDLYNVHSDADLQNAASAPTQEFLQRAEEVYDAAVSDVVESLGSLGFLDADSVEIMRQSFSCVAVKAEFGRRLGGLLRYLLAPSVFDMMPETRQMASPEQAKVLATAWIASICVSESKDPAFVHDRLVDMLMSLARTAMNGAEEQWPHARFDGIPLDLNRHTAMLCHLSDLSLSKPLSASASTCIDETEAETPQPILFHPLRGPYKSQKHQQSRNAKSMTLDPQASLKQDIRNATKARQLANGGRKSEKAVCASGSN